MESLLNSLGSNGPAWTLVAVLIILAWTLIKMLLAEKDKRIEDANKYRDELVRPIEDLGKTLERLEEKTLVAKGRR